MYPRIIFLLLYALSGMSLAADPVRLMLLWEPQSQFAGYYMALEKGIYEQHGLEVELIHSGTHQNPLECLHEGKTDYSLSWLNASLLDDRVGELMHVGQMVNQSNLMLVGWKDLGIEKLKDFDGKKVTIWGGLFRSNFVNCFAHEGIQAEIIEQYYQTSLFQRKAVAGCSVMEYNEYDTLLLSGIDAEALSTFRLRDHGFNLPEDGIYTLRTHWQAHPNEARKLMEASIEGWQYAKDHPEETLDVVMRYVEAQNLPTNRVHMRWMLEVMLKSVFSEDGAWTPGYLSQSQFDQTVASMIEVGLLTDAPAFESFTCSGE